MNINKLIEEFLRKNKRYLVAYILFMFAYPISSVFLPAYYGKIVDSIKNNKTPNFKITIFLLLITNLMYMSIDKLDTIFIPKLQAYIRVNIVKVVLNNYKEKYQEQEVGSLISKIVKLPMVIRDLVRQVRNYIVPLILILLLVMVQFTIIDARLGAIAIIGIISMLLVLISLVKDCFHISADMDSEADIVHEDISELFSNIIDIYSMNTYDEEMKKLENSQNAIIDRYKKTFSCTNKLRNLINFMGTVLFLSIIVYAYKLYKSKEIDMGNMINIAVTGMYVIGKLGNFSGEIPDIVFNMGTYIRIQRYLDKIHLKHDKKESFKIKDGNIKFFGININYGDKQVLKNFNLDIRPGESIAIIGKIGSGKSSLAKALLKLIPYEGNIYVDGKDIEDIDPVTIRSQILFVRQNPIPFNRSLYENISYGNKSVNKEHITELFKKYDLDSFFNHNLDAPVGKNGDKLSGGQRQMIFLLRVLLSQNPIIIMDEPTSSLDDRSAKYVMNILKDIMNSRTVILITHDKNLRQITDRTVELD